jgi:hypothetical protein
LLDLVLTINILTSTFSPSGTQVNEAEANSSDDDDYSYEDEDDVTIGSEDTDISADEINDINAETENMPPKSDKKNRVVKPSSFVDVTDSKPAATATVDDLTTMFDKIMIGKPNFTFHLPELGHHFKNGNKHEVVYDFLYPSISKDFLQMAKVLQNGRQLAILVGMPKWVTSEKVLKAQMGTSWNSDNVRVQARAQHPLHEQGSSRP